MNFPQRGVEIVNAIYSQHVDLARGDDDQRRALTFIMAEQFCFEMGSQWGTKSADPGRPQSKDAIAFSAGDKLYALDWQNGSTREPQIHAGQEMEDITGQHFIPVKPVDHLGPNLRLEPQPEPVDPTAGGLVPEHPDRWAEDILAAIEQKCDVAIENDKHAHDDIINAIKQASADQVAAIKEAADRQVQATESLRASLRDGVKELTGALAGFKGITSLFRR